MKKNKSNKVKKILIIAPHPDDEVLGMGGTLSLLKAKGEAMTLCLVTDGSSTQYKNNDSIGKKKMAECHKAMKILGIKNIISLGFKDMQLDQAPHFKLNESLKKVIDDTKAEMIFAPSPIDLNKDHQLVAESLKVAVRPVGPTARKIYFYEVLSSSEWNLSASFLPNVFIDITDYLTNKIKAFSCYQTEARQYPNPRSPEGIKILAQYRGLQAGVRFAEAFQLYRELI